MLLSRTSTKIVSNVLLAGLLLSCTQPIFAKQRNDPEEYERETQGQRWSRIILCTSGAIIFIGVAIYGGFKIKDAYEGWQRRTGDIKNLIETHGIHPDTAKKLVDKHGSVCANAITELTRERNVDAPTAIDFISQCSPNHATHFLNLVQAGLPPQTAMQALRELGPDCVPNLLEFMHPRVAQAADNVVTAGIALTGTEALSALTACKGDAARLLSLKMTLRQGDLHKATALVKGFMTEDQELARQTAQMQPFVDIVAKLEECARSLADLSAKQDATAAAVANNTDRIMTAINTNRK